jgi:hypothetical protein
MDGKTIHICDVETIAHDEAFEKVLKGAYFGRTRSPAG